MRKTAILSRFRGIDKHLWGSYKDIFVYQINKKLIDERIHI